MVNIDPDQFDVSQVPSQPAVLVDSSAIIGYAYDANSYVLDVFYKGKNQSIYRYYNVFPPVVSDVFDSAGSIGLKARNSLKGYRSQKLK
jgi:hypothetical protein